jgi:hypothetical protein
LLSIVWRLFFGEIRLDGLPREMPDTLARYLGDILAITAPITSFYYEAFSERFGMMKPARWPEDVY